MDKLAMNYSVTAVVNNEIACRYQLSTQFLNKDLINVFPQPANDYVNIKITANNSIGHGEIWIHNTLGELVHTGDTKQGEVININTDNWAPGVYYVLVKIENRNITYKFAVE